MKLRILGDNYGVTLEGVILTPEEYLKHDAYHPFQQVTRTTLFVSYDTVSYTHPDWTSVQPERASRYAVLEATDEERRKLTEAGYKMMNL